MTVNIENLQFTRSLVAEAPPEHCVMAGWGGYCGTACCIGGWVEVAYRLKTDPENAYLPDPTGVSSKTLSDWTGLSGKQFDHITAMYVMEGGAGYSMSGFDRQNDPETRKAVLLTIFDQLIETGGWNWVDALAAHEATAEYLD